MSGCGRQWCSHCRQELIHRDHRKRYESASALGQIIWREGPVALSVADIDVAARKDLRNGTRLLRLLEQKQPGHKLEWAQRSTLELLDAVVVHAAHCSDAAELRLDVRSGVYLIRGEIAAAEDSLRKHTVFQGPQEVTQLSTGITYTVHDPEQLFQLLDPEDQRRRRQAS